ncbi:dienelactone hydrolase [Rhexocercosporidium sp. MPI-PUGE-AT-0058]|nr:dienelactone hydrolase [Rhexocercosporidium sp. MPI-PUGE-AT-0058]
MSTSGITCSACLTGTVKSGTPTGTVEKMYGLDVYVARPKLEGKVSREEERKAKGIIVMIPDMFGWEISNARLLADSYADEGDFLVLLPDFMCGTAPPAWTMQTMDSLLSPSHSLLTTLLKKPIWAVQILLTAIPFLLRNKESIVLPRILSFHRSLHWDPTPETRGLKIGSAGFCWGGKYTILLSHERVEDTSTSTVTQPPNGNRKGVLVDSAFVAHPSKMTFPTDWENIAIPFSMAIGDVDMGIGIEHVRQIQGVLEGEGRGVGKEAEVVVYEGAKHGFAIRADSEDGTQARSAEGAKRQAMRWFGRWLV